MPLSFHSWTFASPLALEHVYIGLKCLGRSSIYACTSIYFFPFLPITLLLSNVCRIYVCSLFVFLSIYLSIYLSGHPPIHLSIYPSIYLSVYLSMLYCIMSCSIMLCYIIWYCIP